MMGPGRGNQPRPEVTTEDLGTRMIDGVLTTGTRRTTIIPEGMQGNDRPMKTTNEFWASKELELTLLSVDYSPLNGTTTTRYENFTTAEPDPSLFMVPGNYSVVDEKRALPSSGESNRADLTTPPRGDLPHCVGTEHLHVIGAFECLGCGTALRLMLPCICWMESYSCSPIQTSSSVARVSR